MNQWQLLGACFKLIAQQLATHCSWNIAEDRRGKSVNKTYPWWCVAVAPVLLPHLDRNPAIPHLLIGIDRELQNVEKEIRKFREKKS